MKTRIYTLLAASISAISLPVVADTSVYGKINLSYQQLEESNEKGGSTDTKDNYEVLSNASRLGFKGDTRINDDVKAIYKLEYEVSPDEGAFSTETEYTDTGGDKVKVKVDNEFKSRNIYVGLQGPLGTLIAGKHDTPTKLVQNEVDRFNDLQYGDLKNVLVGENRENDYIQYALPAIKGFEGLNAAIAAIPGEESGADGKQNQDNGPADKYSIGVSYKGSSYYLGAGYDNNIQNTDLVRLVGELQLGDLGLGALWQSAERHDDKDSSNKDAYIGKLEGIVKYSGLKTFDAQDGYLLSAGYKLGDFLIKAQYTASTSEDVADSRKDLDAEATAIGVDYKLAKATTIYAYTAQISADADTLANDPEYSTFGIGLDHKF